MPYQHLSIDSFHPCKLQQNNLKLSHIWYRCFYILVLKQIQVRVHAWNNAKHRETRRCRYGGKSKDYCGGFWRDVVCRCIPKDWGSQSAVNCVVEEITGRGVPAGSLDMQVRGAAPGSGLMVRQVSASFWYGKWKCAGDFREIRDGFQENFCGCLYWRQMLLSVCGFRGKWEDGVVLKEK